MAEERFLKENEPKKRCLRCLLREMDQEAYMENLYSYIQHLDEDIKAEQALYQERLAVCKECDYLSEGMCRACGCLWNYVQQSHIIPVPMESGRILRKGRICIAYPACLV